MSKMTSWHVGVAAEAFAAAQFARLTYDVSVQYGANQPEYDLIAVNGDRIPAYLHIRQSVAPLVIPFDDNGNAGIIIKSLTEGVDDNRTLQVVFAFSDLDLPLDNRNGITVVIGNDRLFAVFLYFT